MRYIWKTVAVTGLDEVVRRGSDTYTPIKIEREVIAERLSLATNTCVLLPVLRCHFPFFFVTGSLGPVDTTARSSVELGTLFLYFIIWFPSYLWGPPRAVEDSGIQ